MNQRYAHLVGDIVVNVSVWPLGAVPAAAGVWVENRWVAIGMRFDGTNFHFVEESLDL